MKSGNFYIGALLFLAITLIILITPNTNVLHAQSELCPTMVTSAIETTNEFCSGIGENQACYGNIMVEAEAYNNYGPIEFTQPGDVANLQFIQSIQLSPIDTVEDIWGMVRLEVLANLLEQDFETVTLLLFGDTNIDNAVTPTIPTEISINVSEYVNVRQVPSANGAVVGTLAPNDAVQAIGRLSNNSWLRVQLPTGGVGWLYAELIDTEEDLTELRVEAFDQPYYEPMQAFYLRTDTASTNELACNNAPPSGLIIQTPEGMGEITFLINEVTVDIGSTVYFDSPVGGPLSITTVEGQATVTVNGFTSIAIAGTTVTVPMTADYTPAGIPSAPQPYDLDMVSRLPISGLNVQVAVNPPVGEDVIAELDTVTTTTNQVTTTTSTVTNNTTVDVTVGDSSTTVDPNDPPLDDPISNTDDPVDDPVDDDPDQTLGDLLTICHYPLGSLFGGQTIEVSLVSWLLEHVLHGDLLGGCS